MEFFSVTTTNLSNCKLSTHYYINPKFSKNLHFLHKKSRKFTNFAAKDDKNWDKMEVKFGKLVGQNPKLTFTKIKDGKLKAESVEGNRANGSLAQAPNVVLWKGSAFDENDVGISNLSLKPNLSLKMGKNERKERFSDMILVRNPEHFVKYNEVEANVSNEESTCQPEKVDQVYEDHNQSRYDIKADSVSKRYGDATLQGRPQRLDQPVKEVSDIAGRITMIDNLIADFVKSEDMPPLPPLKDREDTDWKRAQEMFSTTGRGDVEMISCSTRGFVVSFGSLIGFLPYRNLATKWKFLAFESWLRRKGVDPSVYRKNLGIIGNFEATSVDVDIVDGDILPYMKLEELLALYDQEKVEYLSTFVGQRIKVNVILADRESKQLIFSVKPKEQEESIQRKRNLMAKLNVGDIVRCCLRKISYFGIFVEIDGVPALIHQTEVSWDATVNPTSSFKIGQVVEAKVHQLDFSLERISLSLKEITPDPLTGALEAVLDDTLEADQPENEWVDLELLVEKLQQYEGIELVTKGRFCLSPGLTSAFQIYMASMFKNQYKLLVRAGNKVQEVVVRTWLSTEEMKHAILMCTNRVE